MAVVGTHTQKEADPEKKIPFDIERHVEDVKQGQTLVQYLEDSMMKPSDPGKKVTEYFVQHESIWTRNHNNQGLHVSDVRKIDGFPPEAARRSILACFQYTFDPMQAPKTRNNMKNNV